MRAQGLMTIEPTSTAEVGWCSTSTTLATSRLPQTPSPGTWARTFREVRKCSALRRRRRSLSQGVATTCAAAISVSSRSAGPAARVAKTASCAAWRRRRDPARAGRGVGCRRSRRRRPTTPARGMVAMAPSDRLTAGGRSRTERPRRRRPAGLSPLSTGEHGPHPDHRLTSTAAAKCPAATTDDPFCRDICVRSSAIVVSVDYRHAPEARFPAAVTTASPPFAGRGERRGGSAGSLGSWPSAGGAPAATSRPSSASWRATPRGHESADRCW
jgi:hypothetical protein